MSERVIESAPARWPRASGVLTTIGIVVVLLVEAIQFFAPVNPIDFLTGTVWSASILPFRFGVIPLVVSGPSRSPLIALIVAFPLGLLAAVYLAEYAAVADPQRRQADPRDDRRDPDDRPRLLRPELRHAAILLKPLFPTIGTFNLLSAGIVVGLLITPLIGSLSEDALRAVPRGLREGAFAMGATRFEVVRRVVFPAALSGIMASIILAMSRAIGETMAVVLADGLQPAS